MRVFKISAAHTALAMRTLKTVAVVDGDLHDLERGMLDVAAERYGVEVDIDALEPVTPEAVAEQITDPDDRLRLIYASLLVAMVDAAPHPDEGALLSALGDALAVADDVSLRSFVDFSAGRAVRGRLRFMQVMLSERGADIARLREQQGLAGVARMLVYGSPYTKEDTALAQRYRKLGMLPEGTLGRAYWQFFRSRDIPLPGEVGSLPEGATRHDLTHVIGGYDTTPMGEIEVLSFTAGMKRTNPFAILFLGIGQFHMGLKIHPVAEPSRMTLTDPRAIVEGLEHGSRCAVDLLDTDWDYWPFIERPLDEVRAELGLA